MVLVIVALVHIVDVLAFVVFVVIALMHVVDVTVLVAVVLVIVAFVLVVDMLTGVMLVFVTLMNFVCVCGHYSLLGLFHLLLQCEAFRRRRLYEPHSLSEPNLMLHVLT